MTRAELPRPTLPTFTLKDRTEFHLHDWCDEQDPPTQPGQPRNYTANAPIMTWKLREDTALYSTEASATITEQTLLNSVSGLQTWNARETHLTSLCHFLNSTVKKVHINHGGARIIEQELEQGRARKGARGPFPFLRLPFDIRIRVYDFLIAEKHTREYHLSYRKSMTVPGDQHSDLFRRRLTFNLTQVNTQFRREFLPRWHHAVGLRFATRPHEDLKDIEAWLEIFGATRIPLTRCFDFEFGHDIVRVDRRGAQSSTLSGYRLKTTDVGVA
ncbi:hypothetical protein TI39_contig348g00044 [Zymoseptoria brevis]|uniref:Uncharacterized protein n=1 Tax=Zymoseptoria brevis TaxID=1047168 RepID=A0A0F4GQZ6_9PEZI|nr:hypothetical protein TI39_contig348g00044 [Zymoseptoria brevis]